MPTKITFMTAGSSYPLTLDVAEEPEKVHGAFIGSMGRPFRLTDANSSRQVYVNPPSIAFWTGYTAKPSVRRSAPGSTLDASGQSADESSTGPRAHA
jgi:hypothetical protein